MGCTLYKRGKLWGVAHEASGERYRLTTLGLADSFARIFETPTPTRDLRVEALLRRRQQLERHADRQLNDDIHGGRDQIPSRLDNLRRDICDQQMTQSSLLNRNHQEGELDR